MPVRRPSLVLREPLTDYVRMRIRKEAEASGRGYASSVAKATGFTPTHVSRVMNGHASVGPDFANALAKMWGMADASEIVALAGGESPPDDSAEATQHAGPEFAEGASGSMPLNSRVNPVRLSDISKQIRAAGLFMRPEDHNGLILRFAAAAGYPRPFLKAWSESVEAMPERARETLSIEDLWTLCRAAYIRWKLDLPS